MTKTLFQATKHYEGEGLSFDIPEGPAFETREEAEAWLESAPLGPEFSVNELEFFIL